MYLSAWNKTSYLFKAKIIGKLLGDGCITKQKGRKPRFQFIHAAKDLGWTNHCYEKLRSEMPLARPLYRKNIDQRLSKGYSISYQVQSRTCDLITYLHSQWYPIKEKVVPFQLLNNFFNKASLAWWYMDDGHLKIKNNIPKKIILSTESFSLKEIEKLVIFLECKYNLNFSIDKQKRIILYDQYQIHYFLHLIAPYFHPSMNRKFVSASDLKRNILARRTTIYLPESIDIKKPTIDINHSLSVLSSLIDVFKAGSFYKQYGDLIFQSPQNQKNYQIVINEDNISNLIFLKQVTGLTFSQLTYLCFLNE